MAFYNQTKNLIFKGAKIYNPYNNKYLKGDILVQDGMLKKIGKIKLMPNDQVIDCKNKIISPGFIDIHSHFRVPGREDKETMETGSKAAMAGGYTEVCIMPNTNPVLDNPESIRFIKDKAKHLPIRISPIGAITIGQKGKELAEIGEMVDAGAVAISDDGIPLMDGQMLRLAIEYSKKYDIPVINHAEDVCLRNNGVVNESLLSTKLGLPANPDISESIMVSRDLQITEFTNGRIHIPHVSTKKSVDIIKEYKKRGINVTAEVTPHHLCLNESIIKEYNTHTKVAPPLRSEEDRIALQNGLIEGTIDCIATDHAPHTIEEKEKDFMHAPCGMIGLESAFAISYTTLKKTKCKIEQIIQWFTSKPAGILGLERAAYKLNEKANIVVINTNHDWSLKSNNIFSRSKNTPMLGMKFNGRVEFVISGKNIYNILKNND
mgnify:FL=1